VNRSLIIAVIFALAFPLAAEKETSKTLSFATYRESDDLVTVLLSSKLAMHFPDKPYFPLLIGVGVRAEGPPLVISRSSFVLIDQEGDVHPMAPYDDVRAHQDLRFARRLVEVEPLNTGSAFRDSHLASCIFYPISAAPTRKEIVELTYMTHIKDIIYFPRPESGLQGVMTLQFMARGLQQPIQLRFEVPAFKKPKTAGG
jgi:hypothetical protein